jgi:long-chain acyl-CoA synthetase
LWRNYRQWGDRRVALRKKELGIWREYTWKDCYQKVESLFMGLASQGVEAGDRISILGDANLEWFWFELAIQACGGIVVGLPAGGSPREVKYLVEHSQSKLVIAQDQEQVDKLLETKNDLPSLNRLIYWNNKGLRQYDDPILMSLTELTASGEDYQKSHPELFEQKIALGKGDDIAIILYTAGTTGLPKGVPTSYRFLLSSLEAAVASNPIYQSDEYVCVTSPGWFFEQTLGFGASLMIGQKLNFPEEADTAPEDLREISPHTLIYPSRLWELVASVIRMGMTHSTWLKRTLYERSLPVGRKVADQSLRDGGNPLGGFLLGMANLMAKLIVFRPLRDKHGLNRVRVPYTAGGMLAPDILELFQAMGVNLRQIFGSAESGIISAHTKKDFKLESVGTLVPSKLIRIANDGEILIHQEGSAEGYFRDPQATQRVFYGGWYHSGDAGYLEEDGQLVFIDRLADMRQLADGTRFSPQYIESRLKFSPYIKDVIVIGGEQREFIAAIVSLDFDNVARWADRRKIYYTTLTDLSQKPETGELVKKEAEEVNQTLLPHSRVKSLVNLPQEFDLGESLAGTTKSRRTIVEERYRDLVEAIYQNKDELVMEAPSIYKNGRTGVASAKIRVIRL